MKDKNIYKTRLQCSCCGKTHPYVMHTLIDTAKDPNAEKKILSSEYFESVCPYCHQVEIVYYPCIYHDGSRKLMIGFAEEGEIYDEMKSALSGEVEETKLDRVLNNWMKNCTVRMVKTEYELQEKVLIAHFGLDDRIIEMARYEMKESISKVREGVKNLYFNRQDDEYVFIVETELGFGEVAAFGQDLYDQMVAEYKDVIEEKDSIEINEEWANSLYRG